MMIDQELNLLASKNNRTLDNSRELKYQTFSTQWRQLEGNFTSDPRFPLTTLAVATRRRRYFAKFDVACKTWGLPCHCCA